MREQVSILFEGVELDVYGYYYKGHAGDYYTPPEPREFEYKEICYKGDDVTEIYESLLTYDQLERLTQLCLDQLF